jgi:hypothetical protein
MCTEDYLSTNNNYRRKWTEISFLRKESRTHKYFHFSGKNQVLINIFISQERIKYSLIFSFLRKESRTHKYFHFSGKNQVLINIFISQERIKYS